MLTTGDIQFLKLVAEGLSDEEIARKRFTTVKSAQSRYRMMADALLPDGKYRWATRTEFIRPLKVHVLPKEN